MKITHLIFILLNTICLQSYADNFKDGGEAYLRGDYENAAAAFIPLAKRGDHRAMYALGAMYSSGQGVKKDITKSFELFSEAAKNGRADAMHRLGIMYEEGLGVEKNAKKATRLYQKSAKKGYPLGQYKLGLMYMEGSAIKQNIINAYAWLVIAGHYFIYKAAEDINTRKDDRTVADNKFQLQLLQQKEKNKILDKIIEDLNTLRVNMSSAQLAETREKVIKLSKYSNIYNKNNFKNIKEGTNTNNLFLLDTLQ